jgi:hypothetical protein
MTQHTTQVLTGRGSADATDRRPILEIRDRSTTATERTGCTPCAG